MANLPPPNHVADLPEDDPEEQPELAPEPDHLNEFALHQIPQPEGNMNGWILEDDEEEEEEEDPEMEEEMEEENDDDDAEVINPYEEADPLNLPPPDSDTESEDMAVAPTPDDHEQEAEADTVGTITRVPYSVRPFSGTVYVGSGPSRQVFAPGPTGRDVNTLHRQVKGLTQQMFDRANTEHSTLKRLSVMDKYLAEFDTDLRSEIKGQHALRRNAHHHNLRQWSFEVQWHLHPFRHYRERPYVAPTAPVAPVDRADPDDPSPHPTRRPRHMNLVLQHLLRIVLQEETQMEPANDTRAVISGKCWRPRWGTTCSRIIAKCAEAEKKPGNVCCGYTSGSSPDMLELSVVRPPLGLEVNELASMPVNGVRSQKKKVEAYLCGLLENIKRETTSSRPVVLNEAVRMAHTLMEQKLQAKDERIAESNKRKWESNNNQGGNNNNNQRNYQNNNRHNQNNNQRHRNARALTTTQNTGAN
ncbi:hypothetical protein Tco_0933631 [Tanacetum coccineum]